GAENYVPESHSLLDGPVPPETDLVLVTGPKHDFLLPELDELARYLKGGGGVLLLLDPAPLPNLARFLASMGIRLGDDFVGDRDLTLNAVAWAAGEESLTGTRTKKVPEVIRPLSPLVLTEGQARAIFLAGVVIEPGMVLLLGVTLVGLRRRRG